MFIYAMLFMAYFFGIGAMIQDVNKTANSETTTAVIEEPCCLQDAICHDGEWYLFDTPCVFDTEACEVMAAIYRDEINVPIAAIAEYVDGCYLIHLN